MGPRILTRGLFLGFLGLFGVTAGGAVPYGVPVNPGDRANTAVSPAGDVDRYVLEGSAGGRLAATVKAAKGGDLRPTLGLLAPDGTPLDPGDRLVLRGRKAAIRGYRLETTGRYSILVSGTADSAGEYDLKVRAKAPRRVSGRRVPLGPGEELTLRFAADTDAVARLLYSCRGGTCEVVAVREPGGGTLPGGRESIHPTKRGGKGLLRTAGGFGDYEVVLGNATADVTVNWSVRVRPAKRTKRRLTLSALEPVIDEVSPAAAAHPGTVLISGENFENDAVAFFGDTPSAETTQLSSTMLVAKVPPGDGTVDITVENPDGQAGVLPGAFTFTDAPTWVIRGTVSGKRGAGVELRLDGDTLAVTTSADGGQYAFTGVRNGTYTVTPVLGGYHFDPEDRPLSVKDANVSGVDFLCESEYPSLNTLPPDGVVKLLFVHPEEGGPWLDHAYGKLSTTLRDNHYFVSDVGPGWDGPDAPDLGGMTDYGDWYLWFLSEELQANGASWSDNITRVLYHEYTQSAEYPRLSDPGGENEIVLLMSGHLNSLLKVDNAEPVEALFGQPWSSKAHTLSNAKEIYRMLLAYFRTHLDKMFVVVTAPPMSRYYPSGGLTEALNARALNVWLATEWLAEADPNWEHKNVYVFDLHTVLSDPDNHHRVEAGQVLHTAAYGDPWIYARYSLDIINNTLTREAVEKATEEIGPVLNVYYHRWREWLHKE